MINFDIAPHIKKEKVLKHFEEPLKFIKKNTISYIEIVEEDEGYIYINKNGEPKDEWNSITIQICDLLNRIGFDAFLSEEDYGYIDVIVLNKW